jgi:predicted dehydrogenase/flavin reductase (DIM6/NTAB) family NADH-FMN oxidoreductase RutF
MILPSRTLWDTRIQCVCSVVAASEADETELWLCANYGQVSFDPPRVIVNPNRLYPIEPMIRRTRRFSLNELGEEYRAGALRLIRLRRREMRKSELAGWRMERGELDLPFLPGALRTLFCEVEEILETGDHTVMIGRIVAERSHGAPGRRPLLYSSISGPRPDRGALARGFETALRRSGVKLAARKVLLRLRPPAPANLPEATYRQGGQTEAEMAQIASYGMVDRSRLLSASGPCAPPPDPLAVCVVGTHWGASHVEALRLAAPNARIFLCGRDEGRTARLARRWKAEGFFVGLEAAVRDPRIRALTLAMPHHLHREAAEMALRAGKHVLVEKPIANTLADADAMIDAARQSGSILMVAENMHYRPTLGAVVQRVLAGDLGEPLHMLAQTGAPRDPEGWVADRGKLGGGVFLDIGIHYVRAMRLLFGEPTQVTAFRPMQVRTKMGGEDGLAAIFSNPCGWQCQIVTTWAANLGKLPDIVLAGDRGTFHLWPATGYFDYYAVAPRPIVELLGYVRPYWLQAKLMRPELQRLRVRTGGPDNGYREEMCAFLTAIAGGKAGLDSANAARRDLEIVLCAYRSMESGRSEEIPPWARGC